MVYRHVDTAEPQLSASISKKGSVDVELSLAHPLIMMLSRYT